MNVAPQDLGTALGDATSANSAGSWWQNLVGQSMNLVTGRWGEQRGTVIYEPDGTIRVKQPQGVAVTNPSLSAHQFGGAVGANFGAQMNPGAAIGGTSVILLGIGAVVLIAVMTKK
jgi:hypothetical protein